MFKNIFNKMEAALGFDFQEDTLRYILLLKRQKQFVIQEFKEIPVAYSEFLAHRSESLRQLEAVFKRIHFPLVTNISIPANYVLTKKIFISNDLNNTERQAEIADNLKYYFSNENESLVFDYVLLNQLPDEDEILLIAAHQKMIVALLNALQTIGLNILAIEVDVYALMRALQIILNLNVNDYMMFIIPKIKDFQLVIKSKTTVVQENLLHSELKNYNWNQHNHLDIYLSHKHLFLEEILQKSFNINPYILQLPPTIVCDSNDFSLDKGVIALGCALRGLSV